MQSTLSQRSVLTNIFSLLIGTSLMQAFTALSVFLTARALGSDSYGAYVACFALTKLTSIAFSLGLDIWLLREGGYDSARIGQLVRTVLRAKSVFGVFWLAALMGIGVFLDDGRYPPLLLALSALTTWLESIINTYLTGYKALLLNKITATISILTGLVLLVGTFSLIFAGQGQVLSYLALRFGVAVVGVFLAAAWARDHYRLSYVKTSITNLWKDLWPYFTSDGLFLIYTYADITIVTLFLGRNAAGIYGPATSILSTIYFIPQAATSVLLPTLSKLYADHDPRIIPAIRRILIMTVLLGLLLSGATYLFGPPVMTVLLGSDYAASAELLKVLCANLFFKSISLSLVAILTAIGWQKARLGAQLVAAVINLVLNLALIQELGLLGVAWIYVVSELVLVAGYARFLPRVNLTVRRAVSGA